MIYSIIITFIAALLIIAFIRAMIRCGNYEYKYHLLKAEIIKLKKQLQPLLNLDTEDTNIVFDKTTSSSPPPIPGTSLTPKRIYSSPVGKIMVSNCGTCPLHKAEYTKVQNRKGSYYTNLSGVRCSLSNQTVPFFSISQDCPLPLAGDHDALSY